MGVGGTVREMRWPGGNASTMRCVCVCVCVIQIRAKVHTDTLGNEWEP